MAVKKILFGALMFACIVALLVGISQQRSPVRLPGRTTGEPRDIKLGCSLPEVSEEVPLLKVIYRDIAPDEIRETAEEVFNLSGDVGELPYHEIFENGGVGGLYVENTGVGGTILYCSGAVAYSTGKGAPHYVPESLPSYEQAMEIAENFMQMIEAHGLVPENFSIQFGAVGPAEITIIGEEEIVHSLSASFRLYYKNFRVAGAGVHVTLGENGEILSFGGLWRMVKEDGHTPITVTPEKAVEMLKSGGFNPLLGPLPQEAVIEDMELVYWIRSVDELQDHLSPVYLFGMVGGGNRWYEVVPATDEPFSF